MKNKLYINLVAAGILTFAFGLTDDQILAASAQTSFMDHPASQSSQQLGQQQAPAINHQAVQKQNIQSQPPAGMPGVQPETNNAHGLAVSPATAIYAPNMDENSAEGKAMREAWTAYNIGNYKKTVAIVTPLAESGNAKAQVMLGRCLESGLGIGEDPGQAVQWYQKAAEQNDYEAIAQLAFCHETGVGVAKNAATAVALMQKAANGGYPEAQFKIAMYFSRGQYGVDKNPVAAFQWAMLAAKQGHAESQRFVGACLEYGLGTKKNGQQASVWYARAAAQGLEKDAGLIHQVRSFSGQIPTSYDDDQSSEN